jgi:DNA-binding Lrp family transcriptional regulator
VTAARNVGVYRPILEPLGLTHPQYLAMLALWERSPRSLGELATALAMDPATASPLVKRLESDGLIERQRSAADERRLDIALTPKGRPSGPGPGRAAAGDGAARHDGVRGGGRARRLNRFAGAVDSDVLGVRTPAAIGGSR